MRESLELLSRAGTGTEGERRLLSNIHQRFNTPHRTQTCQTRDRRPEEGSRGLCSTSASSARASMINTRKITSAITFVKPSTVYSAGAPTRRFIRPSPQVGLFCLLTPVTRPPTYDNARRARTGSRSWRDSDPWSIFPSHAPAPTPRRLYIQL